MPHPTRHQAFPFKYKEGDQVLVHRRFPATIRSRHKTAEGAQYLVRYNDNVGADYQHENALSILPTKG